MNILKKIVTIFHQESKEQAARKVGQEFAARLLSKIESIPTEKFDEFAANLLLAFKSRLDSIFKDLENDPSILATAELRIFDAEIENYQQMVLQDILTLLADEIKIADSIGMHNEVAALIDKIIEPRHDFLVSGAIHLYKEKIEAT